MWWMMMMGSAELAVWVCREEKRVSGLSRTTTCGDVVHALLQESGGSGGAALSGPARSYCIVEKWRGLERALPNSTRMLRLWSAWGNEQPNVRFVLVKREVALSSNGPRSAEARVVQSREHHSAEPQTGEPTVEISQEKRRRVVRKAFRKLEKTKQKKEENSGEKMETLVHLVLSQDHTIRQQTQRIHELDGEIERHEAQVHTDRMRQHGTNYVQDTYLAATDPESGSGAELCARYDEYARLHEELAERQALLERLTGEIQKELDQRWMLRQQEAELVGVEEPELTSENEAPSEEALRIRTQLDTSSYIGLRIHTDLEDVRTQLELSLGIWEAKEHELGDLLKKLDSLNTAEEDEPGFDSDLQTSTIEQSNVWVEQARGLSKTSGNDDDSDTGLSSMHSQDSDNQAVCESLV